MSRDFKIGDVVELINDSPDSDGWKYRESLFEEKGKLAVIIGEENDGELRMNFYGWKCRVNKVYINRVLTKKEHDKFWLMKYRD